MNYELSDTWGYIPLNSSAGGDEETSAMSVDEYLLQKIGEPRRKELYKVIPMTFVYCVIMVTGLVGNTATCVVISKNKFMHTATNYYLFNLAMSDILFLVLGLPIEIYEFWQKYPYVFGETFCLIRTHTSEAATYASILTITAFTVERYVAICHPVRAQTVSNLSRAVKVIVVIWIVSLLCAIPMTVQFGIKYEIDPVTNVSIPESAMCQIVIDKPINEAFEISAFLFFVAPMSVISILYGLIALAVRRSTLSRAGSDSSASSEEGVGVTLRAQKHAKARTAVLKMLFTVVVAFFVCWAPFHVQRLMAIYIEEDDWTPQLLEIDTYTWYISGVLYYGSSTINPIVYSIMSLKFRQAFRNTFMRPCCTRSSSSRGRKNHSKYQTYKFKRSVDSQYCSSVEGSHSPKFKAERNGNLEGTRNPRQNIEMKTKSGDNNQVELVCQAQLGTTKPYASEPSVPVGPGEPLKPKYNCVVEIQANPLSDPQYTTSLRDLHSIRSV
ncbi:pyrokinin-1 receptor [Lingula anatina]|uniref:Pyrokinin-1 receptor n=1 Tax=Lingula anatina TaxID=7574 RepID=A0A1S3HIF3_LINAN|nr:pyrokinin-1 receptor [Lingula anatina]|eukprot:XP_013385873.1 pyrokinin-1 receptor [Lingula anatina]